MTKKIHDTLLRFIYYFELVIAAMIVIALMASLFTLALQLYRDLMDYNTNNLATFLAQAFSVIIGVEFLKMLIKQTPGSVIEVLLFAIARQLVVEHATALEYLLCILAIALLFGIKKYLYVESFDEEDINMLGDTKEPPKNIVDK